MCSLLGNKEWNEESPLEDDYISDEDAYISPLDDDFNKYENE